LLASGAIERGFATLDLYEGDQSQITFGKIDYQKVKGGKEGLSYFSNAGSNKWALLMDHVQYGSNELKVSDDLNIPQTKLALIDSGNDFI
jgi:hypothetical protein